MALRSPESLNPMIRPQPGAPSSASGRFPSLLAQRRRRSWAPSSETATARSHEI